MSIILRNLSFVLVLLVSVSFTKAQGTQRTLSDEGLSIPIFSGRLIKTIDAESQNIQGVPVQSKFHQMERERRDKIGVCKGKKPQVVGDDQDLDFDIEKYRSFSVNGRIFAYLIYYEYIDESGQKETGARGESFYVDKRGDGKFYLDCSQGNATPTIPDWLKP